MLHHWLNEMMNLLAGNSRYVHYSLREKSFFIVGLLLFIGLSIYVIVFL